MAQNVISIQNSLAAGEISPSLFGRTDLAKWKEGTSTCRNFFVDYRGGVQSRPGTVYVGTSKQSTSGTGYPPRLIPFQFNLTQGYALEFGDLYLRIIYQGGYVTEAAKTITGLTASNPGVFTSVSHGFSVGDWIYIDGIAGITQFNGLTWIVNSTPTGNTFTVTNLFGTVVNTTGYGVYTTGGTAARIYTVTSPYAAVDLPYLKYTQSADVMTITCVNKDTGTEYPPYDLQRLANTNWQFVANTFVSAVTAPTNLSIQAYSSNAITTWYSYVVTAVNLETGEESNPSDPISVQNCDIAIYAGTNTINWKAVTGATSYNVYSATPSYGQQINAGNLYGFVGVAFGTTFNDTNIQPDFTTVPPNHFNPFARGAINDVVISAGGANYSPSTVHYSVTTGIGTGFRGQPVVTNGQVSGFVIQDRGSGYLNTDTIAFTDTGGGLATGSFTFNHAPGGNATIYFNGYKVTFVAEEEILDGKSVNTGSTVAITLQNLAAFLNASQNGNLNVAIYAATATQIIITYKTPGAVGNAYTLGSGTSGAVASGGTLTGGGVVGAGAAATLTVGDQIGTYPAAVAYYQQRRVYGSSINSPDTYWMTQPGLFQNMDSSIPTTGADSIIGTPFAQQVNGINWFIPMPGGLVVFTGNSAWQVNGGSSAAITPSDQVATPQAFNGCSALVHPLRINYDILYVQSKGTKVRDLSYNWWIQIYTGMDLTALSNHLVDGHLIKEWCWAEEPYHTVWAIREDGILLCLTYVKEGDGSSGGQSANLYSWTRHDTNGEFVSVCSISEPPIDAVYFVVKRYIQNAWRFYVERLGVTLGENGVNLQARPEDYICHDSSLQTLSLFTDTHKPAATLFPTAATGASVTFTTDAPAFIAGDVGKIIRVGGGQGAIITYNSPTSIVVNITEAITTTTPNDPNNRPIPAIAGTWSVLPLVTTVSKLNHLTGMTVSILADGKVIANTTITQVSTGVYGFTLANAASYISVGLPYTCQVQTLYIEDPRQTVQTKRKNIYAIGARVENSRGLQFGADQVDASTLDNIVSTTWTNMTEFKDHGLVTDGNAVALYTGDYYRNIASSWRVTGQVAAQQTYPLPAKILALVSYWQAGDDQ
jgi:hypothetical protein